MLFTLLLKTRKNTQLSKAEKNESLSVLMQKEISWNISSSNMKQCDCL